MMLCLGITSFLLIKYSHGRNLLNLNLTTTGVETGALKWGMKVINKGDRVINFSHSVPVRVYGGSSVQVHVVGFCLNAESLFDLPFSPILFSMRHHCILPHDLVSSMEYMNCYSMM